MLARDLTRWLVCRSWAYSLIGLRLWDMAGGLRPPWAATIPHAQEEVQPREWCPASVSGCDTRLRRVWSLLSDIFAYLSLSLLLFGQSLLYNSQLNISIRTRLISAYHIIHFLPFGQNHVRPGQCLVLTKGFSPQAIETKACTRFSGLGT